MMFNLRTMLWEGCISNLLSNTRFSYLEGNLLGSGSDTMLEKLGGLRVAADFKRLNQETINHMRTMKNEIEYKNLQCNDMNCYQIDWDVHPREMIEHIKYFTTQETTNTTKVG